MSDAPQVVGSFVEEGYEGRKCLVVAGDNGGFIITEKMAMKIEPCRDYLTTSAGNADEDDESKLTFPVKSVDNRETLRQILVYLDHHKDDPEVAAEEPREQRMNPISDWDYQFVGNNLTNIFLYIQAADYLNIPGLKNICSRRAADFLNVRTPEFVRGVLRLPNE